MLSFKDNVTRLNLKLYNNLVKNAFLYKFCYREEVGLDYCPISIFQNLNVLTIMNEQFPTETMVDIKHLMCEFVDDTQKNSNLCSSDY